MNIVEIKGEIFLIKKDFGDMIIVVSIEEKYFMFFPKIDDLLIPCNNNCETVLSNGRLVSLLGTSFQQVRKDSLNNTYVISLENKKIYFHYNEKNHSLSRVSIPQFG